MSKCSLLNLDLDLELDLELDEIDMSRMTSTLILPWDRVEISFISKIGGALDIGDPRILLP